MADVKGQVDWGALTVGAMNEAQDGGYVMVVRLENALRKRFEPLAKAAEYVVNNPHLFSRHHVKRMRAALGALPKVGG